MSDEIERVRDAIYEAALVPAHLPQALKAIATLADGFGTAVFVAHGDQIRWRTSPELEQTMTEFLQEWAHRNSRAERMLARQHRGFVHELDVYTEEELAADPIFAEFLHPRGLGWGAGTAIQIPERENLVVAVERQLARGPFEPEAIERLDTVRPDIARGIMIASRLEHSKATSVADTLEALGLPGMVLKSNGQVIAANDLILDLKAHVSIGAFNRLVVCDRNAQKALLLALEHLESGTRVPLSLPLKSTSSRAEYVAHIVPMKGRAHDIFANADAILVVTAIHSAPDVTPQLLMGAFDLTSAEARLALDLSQGHTLSEIAGARALSQHTLKTQLKSVFQKLDVRRQSDVVKIVEHLKPLPF
ncbi:MAG: helix-turn-helix transcriptional regulator [Hyphomicrobiales bacterium]|nr:MAG: helix-turn-helix transcriptional regulator [Hyphomicrobiales bacterium]